MGLSREEVEEIKRQHRQKLEQLEAERVPHRRRGSTASELAEGDEEEDRERERERVRDLVSEDFYKAKGYKKYIDHRGKVLWLPPEEYAERVARRRRNQKKSGGDVVLQQKVQQILIYAAVAVSALMAGFFLAR